MTLVLLRNFSYTFKIFFRVFYGENKLGIKADDSVEHGDAIIIPLLALSVPSFIIGYSFFDSVLFNGFFDGPISDGSKLQIMYDNFIISAYDFTYNSFFTLNFFLLASGFFISYLLFYKNIPLPLQLKNKLILITSLIKGEYGFTYLSDILVPVGIKKFSGMLWRKTDIAIIDNFLVNGVARRIKHISSTVRLLQTGYIYHYAFTMIIGLIMFLLLFNYI